MKNMSAVVVGVISFLMSIMYTLFTGLIIGAVWMAWVQEKLSKPEKLKTADKTTVCFDDLDTDDWDEDEGL